LEKGFRQLKTIKAADGQKVRAIRRELKAFSQSYVEKIGAIHPGLRQLKQIGIAFPAFLIPLELRESSDVLMSPVKPKLAIDRMLEALARISRGADPRWYARGFIISMASELEHIEAAARRQKAAFGELRLPIIPLFEEAGSLARSESIVSAMLKSPEIIEGVREHWNNMVEIMVGYSDSAKEAGVLASRLAIAKALPRLERVCAREKVTCVFFHGSGGSVDRGGGRIEDQTAWWPVSALRRYKVTVQGEMVERSFATASIARSQLEKIAASTSAGLTADSNKIRKTEDDQTLAEFAERISARYRETVASPDFLKLVEHATPYSYLSVLKIGSRPVKRVAQLSVSGLRAIPWVLCWTQTRVLFPTWWGVGSAWEETNEPARKKLRRAFREEPVFNSYVKALGFTLAKVELPVWRMYLDKSGLTPAEIEKATQLFAREYEKAQTFFHELTGEEEALWFRPWLAESIRLRSPMIHPLNLLQLLAEKEKDFQLLRIAVTGISSGMLTTG
jgi:phosphoenolpyruvate carboxylase